MDRSIDRGLEFIKARLTQLRRLVTRRGKTKKPLIESLTPQEMRKLTPNQILILEMARKKDAADEVRGGTEEALGDEQYEDYSDGTNFYNDSACHGDYYDAQ